jgi:hypothetical protein
MLRLGRWCLWLKAADRADEEFLAALMRFLSCPLAPIWANNNEAAVACSPVLLGVQVPSDLPLARGWRVMCRSWPASGRLSCRASLRKIYRPLRHYFPSFKSQWMVSQAVVSYGHLTE